MTSDITIRPASEDERAELGELKLRSSLAWGDLNAELAQLPEGRQVPEEHLASVFLAERGGAILGFATVLASTGHDAELEDLFVEPGLWGQGIGRMLIAEAERRAVASGFRGLHVIANKRALPFYEAVGFSTIGTVETLFEPAPEMRKDVA
ncbi:MAG: GNAT family N-acetyltransferase [Phenylobacterium sp.]|uniref:GNAT family N-acetyltransferase n=1 Tax=Phenylobacterium sp. TaxID=1871053 RepID=UPI001A5F902D|nr:GNAT family N-acetyltransferase [Phenylobacterium sp.]MBL8771358.1 GNAT family N-acetyltransferase [Phenylobacterium sp.]